MQCLALAAACGNTEIVEQITKELITRESWIENIRRGDVRVRKSLEQRTVQQGSSGSNLTCQDNKALLLGYSVVNRRKALSVHGSAEKKERVRAQVERRPGESEKTLVH